MKSKLAFFLLSAVLAFFAAGPLFAQGTAFTYQGRLQDNGNPANGNYDFQFSIYNSSGGSGRVAGPVTNSAVAVNNGLFVVNLDFGSGVFTGPARWLDVGVRPYGSTNGFAILSPRQLLTPAPYAIFSDTASNLSGTLPAAQLVGLLPATQLSGTLPASAFAGYTNTVALTNSGNLFAGSFSGAFAGAFNGTFNGNGGNVTNVNVTHLAGILADHQLPANTAFVDSNQTFIGANHFAGPNNFSGTNFFSGPNTFTNSGNSFVGSFFGNGALVGWIATNGTAIQAQVFHGYLLTNSQLVTVTLPSSPSVGDIVRISGPETSGWRVAQNAGQSVIGNFSSFVNSPWTLTQSANSWYSIVSSADGSRLAAAASSTGGGSGGILTSINSGITWNSTTAGNSKWQCIASSADGNKLVAAIYGGGIYTNSGTSWTIVGSGAPVNASWDSLASSADGTKLVAAAYGTGVYVSTNSGATWTQLLASKNGNANWIAVASSADGSKLVAALYGGGIWGNSSGNWVQQYGTPASGYWYAVASSADGSKLVAVANGGGIYTSVNSGGAWTWQSSAPNANWDSVASSSDGSRLAAVVYGGGIYTSSDYGATWLLQSNAPVRSWYSIASSANGTKLAAVVNNPTTGAGGIYVSQSSPQTTTTVGSTGYIAGGQGSAVELQYIGNNQWMPVSSAGNIWAY